MLQGKELFTAVEDCAEEAAFWWLGQHSFIVKLGETVLLIDPFLMERDDRNVPPLFAPADAAPVVDLVVCTHDHIDHIDPEAIPGLAAETSAAFVAPTAHEDRMRSLGVSSERLHLVDDGETLNLGGLSIHAIKAAHEFFNQTEEGYYSFLGYVIEGAGRVVYHAGDTLWWDGLQTRLRRWHVDVAFVPINGRDAKRYAKEVYGNMTYQEAADLIGGLAVGLAVPAHFDMFDGNAENPQLFVDFVRVKYPDQAVWVGDYTAEVSF